MMQQKMYLVWRTTSTVRGDAELVGIYSTEEHAADRVARCRQLPGYADGLVDFVVSTCEVDLDERSSNLVNT
jgi:hypothetical protein